MPPTSAANSPGPSTRCAAAPPTARTQHPDNLTPSLSPSAAGSWSPRPGNQPPETTVSAIDPHLGGQVTKYTSDSSNFGADGPFFRIIREGLEGLVDGDDYFDLLTDDVVFEYVISVPGYPRRVEGRQNIIDLYSGYGDFMTVRSADNLRVYRDREASVVVLEYEVHGESVQTGRPYNNRFVSIITVKDHKVTHWRDYLDPIAVFHAAGWPGTPPEQSRPSSPV